MSGAIAVAGATFIAAFMWREVLIGLPALRRRAATPADTTTIGRYYARVTSVGATRGVLGAVIVATAGALGSQIAADESHASAGMACLILLLAVPVMSARRTWPAARWLGVHDHYDERFPPVARDLVRLQIGYVLLMAAVVSIELATSVRGQMATTLAAGGASFLASTMWNEILIDWPSRAGSRVPWAQYQDTINGYYLVMTKTAVRPNLAAVGPAMVATLAGLAAQLKDRDIPTTPTLVSLVAFAAFVFLAGLHTWPSAGRLVDLPDGESKRKRVQALSSYHGCLVALLLVIVVVEISTLSNL